MIDIGKRILIVSEDEKSAKLYFESFKRDEKLKRLLSSVDIEVVHPKDHSPVGLVKEAKLKKQKAKVNRSKYVFPDENIRKGTFSRRSKIKNEKMFFQIEITPKPLKRF